VEIARLRSIRLFSDLSDQDLAAIAAVAGEREAAPGTVLVAEGDDGHSFFAVEQGDAEVRRGEAVIGSIGPGDVFGEVALLSAGKRMASVVALSHMRLITLFQRDLWQIEESIPAVAEGLRAEVRAHLALADAIPE
jgi:CRP-like cAMP-binding protein